MGNAAQEGEIMFACRLPRYLLASITLICMFAASASSLHAQETSYYELINPKPPAAKEVRRSPEGEDPASIRLKGAPPEFQVFHVLRAPDRDRYFAWSTKTGEIVGMSYDERGILQRFSARFGTSPPTVLGEQYFLDSGSLYGILVMKAAVQGYCAKDRPITFVLSIRPMGLTGFPIGSCGDDTNVVKLPGDDGFMITKVSGDRVLGWPVSVKGTHRSAFKPGEMVTISRAKSSSTGPKGPPDIASLDDKRLHQIANAIRNGRRDVIIDIQAKEQP